MSISVKVNLNGVRNKFSNTNLGRARYDMLTQMKSDMEGFVPKYSEQTNTSLRGRSSILNDNSGISYDTSYAKAQFYGFIKDKNGKTHRIHNYTTPGTSRRWDLRAKKLFMKDWVKAFEGGLTK